jgi:hypothetical protein
MVCFVKYLYIAFEEFEYESDGEGMAECTNLDTQLENLFYDAEDARASNPLRAADLYRQVSQQESQWYASYEPDFMRM